MKRPIFSMLQNAGVRTSLHMPGHHGKALFQYDFFGLDTTELPITDNLYAPQTAIAEAQALLAQSCNVAHAHFLHNGATAGIQAMLLYAKHKGNKIILQRNSHISVYNYCAILNLEPIFVYEHYTENGIPYVRAEDILQAMQANPNACAVLLTSPNYYGVCVDIATIAKCAHQLNMLVLVDEAHGAHLNWCKTIKNAGAYGADIFVQSPHKTLPCLTSNAWILNRTQDDALLNQCLRMVQTSSPSFLNLMVMDDVRAYLEAHADIEAVQASIAAFAQSLPKEIYHVLQQEDVPCVLDTTRLVIQCAQGGYAVQTALANCHIDVEMADEKHIVCIVSMLPSKCKEQLQALQEALSTIACITQISKVQRTNSKTIQVMPLQVAFYASKEEVPLAKSAGRICGTVAGFYPPGTPQIIWGEKIDEQLAKQFVSMPQDTTFGIFKGNILCVKE
ncbi:MAG: aminotransferase class I/II-fold pyridoxal phosphate-dependent enzyme [Eubacteriales bacterium]|nr:aminotransferase class I/II-fold pyridoxal phosphate-dependent enzyme [Eubacteriales bacterium]